MMAAECAGGLAIYKVIILGDTAVGKTSLLRRLRDGDRAGLEIDLLTPTIGVDLQLHRVTLPNGFQVQLEIWDTAGQERFHRITRQYYRGAQGIIFVYDVTNRQSLDDITRWLHNANDCCAVDFINTPPSSKNQQQPVFMLLGNKIDLVTSSTSTSTDNNNNNNNRRPHHAAMVSHEEGLKLHDHCNMSAFYQVSAKTGQNVAEAFERLAFHLVNNWDFPSLSQTFSITGAKKALNKHDAASKCRRGHHPRITDAQTESSSPAPANSKAAIIVNQQGDDNISFRLDFDRDGKTITDQQQGRHNKSSTASSSSSSSSCFSSSSSSCEQKGAITITSSSSSSSSSSSTSSSSRKSTDCLLF